MLNTETIKTLKKHNKITNALFSLIENIKTPGLYCVDLADFLFTTKESQNFYILVEKQQIQSIETIAEIIKIKNTPNELKTIWVDIWFGSKEKEDNVMNVFSLITETIKLSLPENVELIITDACNLDLKLDYISVIGFD